MGEGANRRDDECDQTDDAEQTALDIGVEQLSAAERRCGITLVTEDDSEEVS